ncbi:MAG: metallophosphoesterase, partial [Acidobacteria bacterium]|nr:metallophosphoesterase [Acidobacteriota bacterium]
MSTAFLTALGGLFELFLRPQAQNRACSGTSYTPGSAQLEWLAADLAASRKTWKFVLLHEPGWSAAGGDPNNSSVQAYVEPLCEQNGVSIVFAGHNHFYSRAALNGVTHITTGGGGAPLNIPIVFAP